MPELIDMTGKGGVRNEKGKEYSCLQESASRRIKEQGKEKETKLADSKILKISLRDK